MSSIKQGIVQRLGQVFEAGWQRLHHQNGDQEAQKKTDNEKRKTSKEQNIYFILEKRNFKILNNLTLAHVQF